MAIIAGAGSPAGGGAAGTGKGLTYVGEHCFAYSGTYAADGASHTVLDFFTGSDYIVGTVKVNGALNPLSTSVAGSTGQVRINGEIIGAGPMVTALDNPYFYSEEIVIQPNSRVQVLIIFNETDSNDVATATFTGRTYR